MSEKNPLTDQDRKTGKLKNTYLHWSKNHLNELNGYLQILERHNPNNSNTLIDEIYNMSHNIKGLGGSFGFYLMTDIATSLCKYLHTLENTSEINADILKAHISAMDKVISQGMDGEGGEAGLELLNNLKKSM